MKTNDLINLLASGPDVATKGMSANRALLLLSGGMVASIVLMLTLLGIRPNLAEMALLPAFWLKIAFVFSVCAVGWTVRARLSIPGSRLGVLPVLIGAPLLLIWVAAAIALGSAAPAERAHLFWGDTWRYCSALITLLSLPILVATLYIMRNLAPTRLRLAGAAAGFASGGMATVVYSLHCPEIAAPFIGFWYVIGILIPTGIGAWVGPRALRW